MLYGTGVLVAAKQRQEFRISLQRRARHRAEKRAEWLETEVSWREVSKPHKHYHQSTILVS